MSPGGYWFSHKVILGGSPLRQIGESMPPLLLADMNQKLFYSLTENTLTAYRLKSSVESLTARRVVFPGEFQDASKLFDNWGHRSYLLDHPIAATHRDRLFLFFRPAKGGVLLSAEVEAFESLRSSRTSRGRMSRRRSSPQQSDDSDGKNALREWKSRSGKFSVEAWIASANDSEVELNRSDGISIKVPLAQLSDEDRDYVKSWRSQQEATEETNPFAVPGDSR